MKNYEKSLSPQRLYRIREQGYSIQTDKELSELAFGNRFAYILCTTILLVGVTTANIPLLIIMNIIALLGVLLPNHPFDYIYNLLISKLLSKPTLPPRSAQLQFSCSVATIWITATILLFHVEMMVAGYVMGATLILIAALLSTLDLCIPSIMYNKIFGYKLMPQNQLSKY